MTPDLSYYWEGAREYCEDTKWEEEKKKKNTFPLEPVRLPNNARSSSTRRHLPNDAQTIITWGPHESIFRHHTSWRTSTSTTSE